MHLPAGFTDLHCHLLPGVDDGSKSLEESVSMLRIAHAGGTRRIAATPHMFLAPFNNNDPAEMRKAFDSFTNELAKLSGRLAFLREMSITLGAENYLSPEFFAALEDRQVLTINGGNHVLIEFSGFMPFEQIDLSIRRVVELGYCPILAHVERYKVLRDRPQRLRSLAKAGCLIQINAGSLLAPRGSSLRRLCLGLLKNDLVHIIASDAHDTKTRKPNLGRAYDVLEKRFPQRQISRWFSEQLDPTLDERPS